MTIVPLGTAAAAPTRTRHLSSIALIQSGRILLLDCGEGVQRRLLDAGLKHGHVDTICITHLHGDHFIGLFGLLSTMALSGRTAPLTLLAPADLVPILDMLSDSLFKNRGFELVHRSLNKEFRSGVVHENALWVITARTLEHRVFTVGYRVQERARLGSLDADKARAMGAHAPEHFRMLKNGGSIRLASGAVIQSSQVVGPPPVPRSFAYLVDTRPCEAGQQLATDASLVLHDATFSDEHQERAERTGHSTAREAAAVARRARAGRLLLSHFSARYSDIGLLVRQAKEEFPYSAAAVELGRYSVGDY